jgi:hypothetical protein
VSFLAPMFLLGLAAVAIPVLLHLFARDTGRSVPFTTVRFLRRAPVEQARRKRVSDWLLLALRAGALALLAFAFARPYIAGGEARGSEVAVVAVDTSLSMSAPATWAEARVRALEAVRQAPAASRVALIAFDDEAREVVGPTADRGVVERAVATLEAGAGTARHAAAIARGREMLAGQPGEIAVVTDLQRPVGPLGPLAVPEGVRVRVVPVTATTANLHVASVEATPDGTIAVIRSHGPAGRTTNVRLAIDGREVAVRPLSVGSDATVELRFAETLADGSVARVSVEDPVGPQADNVRYLVTDPPPPVRTLIVTTAEGQRGDAAFYLRRALEATERPDEFSVRSIDASDSAVASLALQEFDVVALVGTRGLDRRVHDRLSSFVEAGGGLFISLGPRSEATLLADMFRDSLGLRLASAADRNWPTRLAPVELRHPVFAAFGTFAGNLGQVRIDEAAPVAEGDRGRALARFTNGLPALVEYARGGGRVFVLATDVARDWNDFPLHPTFVPFVHESVRYLAGTRAIDREAVVSSAGAEALRRPGIATLGEPPVRVAVNVDPRESLVVPMSPEELLGAIERVLPQPADVARLQAAETEARQAFWRYGLWAMLGVLAVESLVAARRRRLTSAEA